MLNYLYVLIGLLSLSFIIQIYYFLRYFSALSFYKFKQKPTHKNLPISVIIAARNEANNLQAFLESILTQDYPEYEVIVVNDCSYDQSSDVLKGFQARYSHIKVLELEEDDKYKHGKKFALTLGIKAAKHEHLLFTDADCKPHSKNWIREVQAGFTEGKEIVISYSPFIKSGGFLNAFSRFETFYTAFQYISFALRRNAYMGVGRNLAYTKTLFFKNKGFASHMHLLSGDDDLFVNANATKTNVSVVLAPDAFVFTPSQKSWGAYFKQKLRHLPDAKEYKSRHKFSLGMFNVSAVLFMLMLILCFILPVALEISLSFLAARILLSGLFYFPAMKKLATKDLFFFYPILELLYFLIIPLWALVSFFIKPKKWK
jgi:cellulose synthase/poly-beta-1,6-N-acetylglucosamine synthase-like glycosyltransferase